MRSVSKLFCLGLALTAVFATSACSYDKKEDSVSGDLPVQVPVYSEGKYQLSIFNLTSMVDLVHLNGASVRLLMDPHVFKNQLRGRPPELQYIRNSHGVIVPTDFDSLQLLTIYSQFEKLHQLDKSLGVDTANKWPVTVAVNVRTKNNVTGGMEEDNAFYTSQFDAYLFAPYKQDQLPLMVNGGVIAHEHFHSLYQHLVIDPLKDKYPDASRPSPHDDNASLKRFGINEDTLDDGSAAIDADQREKYHSILLHGVNEGLADVWGWIYTGDENFVGRSLKSEAINRNLALPNYRQFFPKDLILRTINAVSISQLGRVPYDIGTQLARTMKTLMQKHYSSLSDAEVRQKMALLIVKTLPVLRDRIGSLKTDEYLSLTDVATMMASQIGDLTTDDCQFLNQLIPSSDRPTSYHCGDIQ
jgi:hypothetical protein